VLASAPAASGSTRHALAVALSIFLWAFLADGLLSLADDSLGLCLNFHFLGVFRRAAFLFVFLFGLGIYLLIGFTPAIPKRIFLPISLFNPAVLVLGIPALIFAFHRVEQFGLAADFLQVIVALAAILWTLRRPRLRWPLIAPEELGSGGFRWSRLLVFLGINAFILAPALVLYLWGCAVQAIGHFSEGFLILRPSGLSVQVRTYVREDAKMVRLYPMAHIADAAFYRKLSGAFATNAIVLLEGVTDDQNLLTNKITYARAAKSLGLAEQQHEFKPTQGTLLRADVDVADFSPSTIGFLNLAMVFHSRGLDAKALAPFWNYSPSSDLTRDLIHDLVEVRNRRLLTELKAQLLAGDNIVVPWGAAHMPGIAKGLQELGFRLERSEEYAVIRFGPSRSK